jgi:pyruvate/2-oxoglutarate/acetoin dehydrogenase E1 component
MMYGVEFDVTAEELNPDFLLPLYKANIERSGTDITKIAHAKMVGFSL